MSFGPGRQNKLKLPNEHNHLPSTSRKKSDSTLQVVENVKQKLIGHNADEQNEQEDEFQGQLYRDLSSGVYQMSRKSQREDQQQDQKEYYSQQIKVGYELTQPKQEHKALQQGLDQRYREIEMQAEQYMSKVLMPKSQSQEIPHFIQQSDFTYPSMMESSRVSSEQIIEQQVSDEAQQQMCGQNQKQLRDNRTYNQPMNIQVSRKLENILPSQRLSEEMPQTQDLLNIENNQKPKCLRGKPKANRIQVQINDEQGFQQNSKVVNLDERGKLKILGYYKQYFLKIETQVYQIQFCSCVKSYTFDRKFADFVLLDKLIRFKYPGYILYPFPQNNLEFFNKIKLSVGTELQKAILIEKRLLQLQKYLNFLFKHRQLGNSQAFKTFIAQSDQHFSRHLAYLQTQLVKEEQKFGSSKIKQNYKSIKNFVMSGFSFFASYVSSSQQNAHNATLFAQLKSKSETLKHDFDDLNLELDKNKLIASNIQIKAEKLLQIYESNIQMKPIESSIDSVLRLSSKMASSKTAYELNKNWLQDKMLSKIYYFVRIFTQVQEQIEYRKSLLQKIDMMEQEQAKLGMSIIQRVQTFDSRFVEDWAQLKIKFEDQYFEMIDQFSKQWQFHCIQMSKIWK